MLHTYGDKRKDETSVKIDENEGEYEEEEEVDDGEEEKNDAHFSPTKFPCESQRTRLKKCEGR